MLVVRFTPAMLLSRRTAVCLSDSSPDVLPSALLVVPLLACFSLALCLLLAQRQLIVCQSVPAYDACFRVQAFWHNAGSEQQACTAFFIVSC